MLFIKNKMLRALLMSVLLLLFLTSCGQKENYNVVGQNNTDILQTEVPATETNAPSENSSLLTEPISTDELIYNFDPLSEEDTGDLVESDSTRSDNIESTQDYYLTEEEEGVFGSPTEYYDSTDANQNIKFAGATPIPILPIDIPTPTPQQALQFTYTDYEATKLNLKFKAPAGWEVDDSAQDVYKLTEPIANQKDGFSAEIILRAIPLSKEYSSSDLNREIKSQLEQMGLLNYTSWSPSLVSKRELLGKTGLYANYKGTLVNGVKIRGRLHMVAIGTTLYSVQITGPSKYNTDFIGVHTQIRRSIAFINAPN